MPRTVLHHPLALNPSALDIRHQLIKILDEWQIISINTYPIIGYWGATALGGSADLKQVASLGSCTDNETVNLIAAVKAYV
ncbi:MAG: hypothetical protein KME55_26570 [Nostoc indistinguendum CM1-VF10]|jgi:hypothetical protein|nr:hypothetical protein [Nostoc indistinguendum CM1-VF10]